jgi:hypothetical protein
VSTSAGRQLGAGRVLDVHRRRLGRFTYACRLLSGGDERCSGSATIGGDRLRIAGPAREAELEHRWHVLGGTGAFAGARGRVVVDDLDDQDSVITVSATLRGRGVPRGGLAPVAAANRPFLRRADRACRATAARLERLPRFPFGDFDPLHPDPQVLPAVGRWFTGPGHAGPELRRLLARLRALGPPPAARARWHALLRRRRAALAIRAAHIRAARAADAAAFLATVDEVRTNARRLGVDAVAIGARSCRT